MESSAFIGVIAAAGSLIVILAAALIAVICIRKKRTTKTKTTTTMTNVESQVRRGTFSDTKSVLSFASKPPPYDLDVDQIISEKY